MVVPAVLGTVLWTQRFRLCLCPPVHAPVVASRRSASHTALEASLLQCGLTALSQVPL